MKLIIFVLISITIADGQLLSGLLSAFSGFPFASASTGLGSATAGLGLSGIPSSLAVANYGPYSSVAGSLPSGSVSRIGGRGPPTNPFSPNFQKDLDNYIARSFIDSQRPTQQISNYNVGLPQNYFPNVYTPPEIAKPTPRPLRPAFKYPSIKNSLNTADANLKGIASPNGGGLSVPNGRYFYG